MKEEQGGTRLENYNIGRFLFFSNSLFFQRVIILLYFFAQQTSGSQLQSNLVHFHISLFFVPAATLR